ncbi:Fur family transcriptional regulator [Dermatophilus congolensis]|uniref:Ferric uptake regulation protein n=1 Tax=Dermatophilus congolensis TaxID=1863 RepID=A0A239V5U0_9MICO|nr:Fur family transcriptional regulator [Dermatophilus congolensis]MBO3130297.1 transcriptional repressor [Dermatophilus congolensis]MBO3131072.1 transcriptional repressor [Dermatophilus congolensis]MBO3134768.1 transcriptional repressor [Dermatophilus congolensis]MBO3137004.1 transcriptional repressor [Dermatophilus congolensis]MBO3139249.1 transcriptional repressor [Dermatophilus congolensis]
MAEPRRRNTRQRAAIEALLKTGGDFVSAQQVHARLTEGGSRAGLATVYRTLGVMSAAGKVDVLRNADGELIYRWCDTEGHHHHLVCRQCGYTVEIRGTSIESWADAMADENGFTDVSHSLELFGLCASCSAQPSPPDA